MLCSSERERGLAFVHPRPIPAVHVCDRNAPVKRKGLHEKGAVQPSKKLKHVRTHFGTEDLIWEFG